MPRLPSSRFDRALAAFSVLVVVALLVALFAYFVGGEASWGSWWVPVLDVLFIALNVRQVWQLSRPAPKRGALASRES